jgi:hypothetical protein
MSMPAYNSFQLYKGDTLKFKLTLKTSGSAYNIPLSTDFAAAVKEKGSSTIAAEFNTEILSASSGTILFTLPSADSSLLSSNKNWVYDVQLEDSSGVITTLLTGNIFVTDEVTQ